jgi:hypothetical protein
VRSGLIDEHVALLSHDQPSGNMGRGAIPTIVGVEAQSGLLPRDAWKQRSHPARRDEWRSGFWRGPAPNADGSSARAA